MEETVMQSSWPAVIETIIDSKQSVWLSSMVYPEERMEKGMFTGFMCNTSTF